MAACSLKEVTDLTAGLLGGQVRLFTTQCVMHEIKALGKEYKGMLLQYMRVLDFNMGACYGLRLLRRYIPCLQEAAAVQVWPWRCS